MMYYKSLLYIDASADVSAFHAEYNSHVLSSVECVGLGRISVTFICFVKIAKTTSGSKLFPPLQIKPLETNTLFTALDNIFQSIY